MLSGYEGGVVGIGEQRGMEWDSGRSWRAGVEVVRVEAMGMEGESFVGVPRSVWPRFRPRSLLLFPGDFRACRGWALGCWVSQVVQIGL